MAELAKIHTDRLQELKNTVEESQQYFSHNVKRFEKFIKFVFKSSMNDEESSTVAEVGMPTLEFNILESYVSSKRGEFAKQQPSLNVRAADGLPSSMLTREFVETINLVEAHLRAVFFDGANDMLDYNVYSDLLAGGFSVLRVYTEYVNEKAFEQNICVERVFDPTLTVFDPLARKSHKGDGRFCAELYPMTRKQFEDEFGEDAANKMKFTRNLSGFDWSFQNEQVEIVLVCDFYERKTRRETIYKLTNGHSVTKKEYEKFLEEWEEAQNVEQPPAIMKERKTICEYICRYRFCESDVLDYKETNYKYLPLVFVDGNSVNLKDGGSYTQMTRPYVYHAEGIQRLKNFAGQSLANELENTIQHKFVVAIESVPEDYQEPYQNVQKADVLMYNHFLDTNNPNVILPPPREINRTPIPPEITNTFKMSDEMTQAILGSFDSSQGVNNAALSGIAFARSAIQGNNASVPYIVGYIKGLNRVAQIYVDLFPKYYRTPRSLPILKPNGEREYIEINKKGSLYMNYDPAHLQVKVETGVNFAMQKEIAIQTVIAMSQANKAFAEFFAEEGLPVLLDNIEIRGIDDLKQKANVWMENQKKMKAMQMQSQQKQMQMQEQEQQMQMAGMQKELQSPTEQQVNMMAIQQQVKVDDANLAIKQRDSETKFLEVMSKIRSANVEAELRFAEVDAENERTAVESAIKVGEHINNTLETHHNIRNSNNGNDTQR
jgi:hypothetical protein